MFFSLLGKECKMWLKSILFYAYAIVLMLFYITQMDSEIISRPSPADEGYKTCYTTDENIIMEHTLANLITEYASGSFSTYPVGFYKNVIPDQETMQKIGTVISNVTGLPEEQWRTGEEISVKTGISFAAFKEQMGKAASLIGPGSRYTEESLHYTETEMTYEQAKAEYEAVCSADHVTGAYARLFCDYAGLILGILPAFFGAARVLRDKRSRATQVLYTKAASSVKVIAARYLAIVTVLFVPVLLLSCVALSQGIYVASAIQVTPDYLAFVKYSLAWLLPTVLFVTAMSYAIAEATESILTVLLCLAIWFSAIFMGNSTLTYAGWNMMPRFNLLGSTRVFESILPQLVKNRILYSGAAILLVICITVLFAWKRKGGYHGRTI